MLTDTEIKRKGFKILVENGGFGAAAALPVAKEMLLAADRLGYVRKPEVFKMLKPAPPGQGRIK